MKITLQILLLLFLGLSNKSFAQLPIFMPTSESSILAMHPCFTGLDYKSRISINQLYQSHPLGDLHTVNTTYDVDLPKLNMVTGLQLAGDRMGSKNQNLMFRWNVGYLIHLSEKVRMVYTIHVAYANQSIDAPTYFNRFNYYDTLFTTLSGTSQEKYFEQSIGSAFYTPYGVFGLRSTLNRPYLGQFNGSSILLTLNTNIFLGLNLKTAHGTFKPIYSYSYYGSWNGMNFTTNPKFPTISNHNIALNYHYKKWTSGIGIRTIKHHPNMYHAQVGVEFDHVKLGYSVGLSPYKNLANERQIGITSQATMEFYLNRSKYYHRPVYRTEIEEFPDHTTKFERNYMDDQLIESIEYYDNGMEKIRMSYQDGLLNGFYTEYNDNGDYIMEGQYRKGLKNGVWSYYNAEGYRFKTEKYYMGKLLKSKTFEPEMY
jgi:hypothetical protein